MRECGVVRNRSASRPAPKRDNAYSALATELDLKAALIPGLERNDLLPPRPEDRAGGQVAQRFVAALETLVLCGRYEADRAVLVPVAKVNYATRPAALLTAADRVVYHSLVEPLRARLEKGLVSSTTLLWPRAELVGKQWASFERSPMSVSGNYIVRADVAGFYESIDHEVLGDRLIRLTGRVALVDLVIDFLGQVMGAPRGLPQGLAASDALATAYLSTVDAGMLRHGYAYWRHGDDVRVTVTDHDAGRRAVARLESLLRAVRLLLNADKTRVLKRATYERQSGLIDLERQRVRDELTLTREKELLAGAWADDDIESLVERAGIDTQTQWDLFYHGSLDLEDIADQLRPHLNPTDVELAKAMYRNALERAPDKGGMGALGSEEFHGMLSHSLTTLIASRDSMPLTDVAGLIARYPSETELLATYLRAVASTEPAAVCGQVLAAIDGYATGWQQAWLLGALREVLEQAPGPYADACVERVLAIARDEESPWLARGEAARCLGAARRLDQELLSRLWGAAPTALRSDLAAAVSVVTGSSRTDRPAWAEAFLDSLQDDPMLAVVVQRAQSLR